MRQRLIIMSIFLWLFPFWIEWTASTTLRTQRGARASEIRDEGKKSNAERGMTSEGKEEAACETGRRATDNAKMRHWTGQFGRPADRLPFGIVMRSRGSS